MIIEERTPACDVRICQNHGSLVTTENAFGCNCAGGFTGNTCEIYIDECSSNPCSNNPCPECKY